MPAVGRPNYADPRLQPGAYIRHGHRLVEVRRSVVGCVTLEDAVTDRVFSLTPQVVLRDWKLVRAATAPDFPPQPEAETIALKGAPMKNVLAAAKDLLSDVASLQVPTLATAAAGLVLPLLSAFGVVDLSAAELTADLVAAGTAAGVLEKLLAKPAQPAPAPAPAKKSAK